MKHLSTLVVMALPALASAQITIGEADMPVAGDTVRRETTVLTTFDDADTGPAHTWDFSTLTPGGTTADTCVAVDDTPVLYQFFFNNGFLYPDWNADFAVRGTSINFQTVQIEDVFDYFKNNGDGFRNVGFGATINGLPASVQRDPIDWVYHFPLNYGDADSGPSEFLISVPGLGYYGQNQTRDNEVDGWGTLYLPTDTFEVLRVKSVVNRVDTIYLDQFGFGFSFPEPEIIEYKWLAAGMDQPVLQVNTLAGAPTLTRFYYDLNDIVTLVPNTVDLVEGVMPNPASDAVRVQVANGVSALELTDASGRVVRTVPVAANERSLLIDVRSMSEGAYVLRAQGERQGVRLIVVH